MASKKEKEAAAALAFAMAALKRIVEATNDPARGSLYTPESVHKPLIEKGFVEINAAYKNEAGEIATRATEKGVKEIMDNNTPAAIETATAAKPSFVVVTSVPLPTARTRGGKGGNVYPFDSMEVGASFFVAATADKPEPAKSLASTVSSATARFAEVVKDDAGNVVMENHTVAVYKTGEDGKRVKGEDGKLVKLSETVEQRPKTVNTKEFTIRAIEDGAAWGFTGIKGAGIWRTK